LIYTFLICFKINIPNLKEKENGELNETLLSYEKKKETLFIDTMMYNEWGTGRNLCEMC
jgi:hypothetical protein